MNYQITNHLLMEKLYKTKEEYKEWLISLKSSIQKSQIKAAIAVNSQLKMLYWNLGKEIIEKQEKAKWGSGFIDQLSKDLKNEFPDMGGFSAYNLRMCKSFYAFYAEEIIVEQVAPKLALNSNLKQIKLLITNILFEK